jgi:putative ABC transport system permease protein
MAYGADERRVVVSLKAVDGAYPLYGSVLLDPPGPLADALADGGAVVEAALLPRLGLAVGDPIRVGEAEFVIRGVLLREPDRVGGFISIGPRVMIHADRLAATETILPGSVVRYSYGFALPAGADAGAALVQMRDANPDARWRVRGTRDVQPQVTRFTDRLSSYLTHTLSPERPTEPKFPDASTGTGLEVAVRFGEMEGPRNPI